MLFKSNYIDLDSLSSSNPVLFMPALFLLFFGIVASGLRWWILLKIAKLNIDFKSAIYIQLIGNFFSSCLPGAAGGDVVRSVYVYKKLEKGTGRSTAFLSIILDRLYSLFGLIAVACLLSIYLALNPQMGIDVEYYISIVFQIIKWGVCLFVTTFFLMLALWKFKIFRFLPSKLAFYSQVSRDNIKVYLRSWHLLTICGFISMIASAAVALGIAVIASMFPYSPGAIVSAIAGVFGNLFSAIPITPGGLGVGESVFAKICSDLANSSMPFATIYLTFRMGMLIVNIPGGLIALFWHKIGIKKFKYRQAFRM